MGRVTVGGRVQLIRKLLFHWPTTPTVILDGGGGGGGGGIIAKRVAGFLIKYSSETRRKYGNMKSGYIGPRSREE